MGAGAAAAAKWLRRSTDHSILLRVVGSILIAGPGENGWSGSSSDSGAYAV